VFFINQMYYFIIHVLFAGAKCLWPAMAGHYIIYILCFDLLFMWERAAARSTQFLYYVLI